MDAGREHRIGGGENGTEQHGRARGQVQHPPGERGDQPHRQGHGQEGQAGRQHPAAVEAGDAHLEPDREEGNEDGDLRKRLEKVGGERRIGRNDGESTGAQQIAHGEIDHGAAERESGQLCAHQHHRDEQHPHQE